MATGARKLSARVVWRGVVSVVVFLIIWEIGSRSKVWLAWDAFAWLRELLGAAGFKKTYLPWIGYFDLIDSADQFVFLDDAQVLKRSWGVRNRILGQNGETFLTVPLSGHTHGEGSVFVDTRIDSTQNWAKTHLATIRHAYAKAPHFADVFASLETLLMAGLSDLGSGSSPHGRGQLR